MVYVVDQPQHVPFNAPMELAFAVLRRVVQDGGDLAEFVGLGGLGVSKWSKKGDGGFAHGGN